MQDVSFEIIERLTLLGLDEREAKLYVRLALQGPARASDAALSVRLKRTETYRALEALAKRGFVTARLERPVVYEAVAPDMVFADLLSAHEQRRAEIETLRERVIEAARSSGNGAGQDSKHGYKILQGRRTILTAVEAMVRNATARCDVASTVFGPVTMSAQNRAWRAMLARAAEGLPVRLLLRESAGVEKPLAPFLDGAGASARFFDPPVLVRIVLVDEREVVTWLVTDPSAGMDAQGDVAMWTNAPDLVGAKRLLFGSLWEKATPVVRAIE